MTPETYLICPSMKIVKHSSTSSFRIKGRSSLLQYYYSLYCTGYALYLLFVIMATEWFMGYRFLTYGYVTVVNQVTVLQNFLTGQKAGVWPWQAFAAFSKVFQQDQVSLP